MRDEALRLDWRGDFFVSPLMDLYPLLKSNTSGALASREWGIHRRDLEKQVLPTMQVILSTLASREVGWG